MQIGRIETRVKVRIQIHRSQRKRHRSRGRAVWVLGVAVFAVAAALTVAERMRDSGVTALLTPEEKLEFSVLGSKWPENGVVPERLVYPFSIVPGGVATAA